MVKTLGSEDSGTPGIEVVSAVETDESGNIYVTGHTVVSMEILILVVTILF